ncbi:hypothetical protein ACVGX7_00450, partial [Enterobacter hormaechei]
LIIRPPTYLNIVAWGWDRYFFFISMAKMGGPVNIFKWGERNACGQLGMLNCIGFYANRSMLEGCEPQCEAPIFRGAAGIDKGAAAAPLSRSHAVKKLYSVDLKVNGTVPQDLYK